MREVTLVLPHFQNLGMLQEQQAIWADYPQRLRRQLHVIVVDDCSQDQQKPGPEHMWIDGLASVRLFRLLQKKRWNWLACRNLGALKATSDWLLLTDIDHGVPVETLDRLVNGPLDERSAYRFKRIVAPKPWPYDVTRCATWKPHNDSWLLTRQLFFYDDGVEKFVSGYDERLSGCYGTSGEFKDRVSAVARTLVELNEVLIRYPREVIADASTPPSLYPRKNNTQNDEDLAKRKRRRESLGNWRPLHGLTKFEAVPLTKVVGAC
jgi:hypothetical protein